METITAFQAIISFFTALNALGVFVLAFRAGRYTKQVDVNTVRLDMLERTGSPAVQTLMVRLASLDETMNRVEDLLIKHITEDLRAKV